MDIPRLLGLGRKFHELSPYKNYDSASVEKMVRNMIENPDCIILVNANGFIGGVVQPLYFGGGLVAQEMFWFAESKGMELLTAFEEWGISRGAVSSSVSALILGEREDRIIDKIYKRKGYTLHERAYYKEFK